jgi:hypothetical protein
VGGRAEKEIPISYQLQKLVIQIATLVGANQTAGLRAVIEDLTDIGQSHLNNEWLKAKIEAKKGTLS